jgi:hypothetical protein
MIKDRFLQTEIINQSNSLQFVLFLLLKLAIDTLLTSSRNYVSSQGILEFYNLPIPSLPTASSNYQPSLLPEGVQFVLNTLPVRCDQLLQLF